jgi:hypothetical protein
MSSDSEKKSFYAHDASLTFESSLTDYSAEEGLSRKKFKAKEQEDLLESAKQQAERGTPKQTTALQAIISLSVTYAILIA